MRKYMDGLVAITMFAAMGGIAIGGILFAAAGGLALFLMLQQAIQG